MRSMNKGDDWKAISKDLTNGGKKGNVAYGTLTSISESPFEFGLIYTGSDDGMLHVTKNAGGSWKNISGSLPKDLWVTRVIASQHKKERVYVALNGYRWDDFNVYIYVSEDYGNTWENIKSNIPIAPVNVVKEDPENENILYLGTDNGAYVTFNKGGNWEAFNKNLPAVAVHDLVVQPEAKELLLGTHGRSIYKTNIAPLQKVNANLLSKNINLFPFKDIHHSSRWGSSWSKWFDAYEPSKTIEFYVKMAGKKEIKILSERNSVLNTIETEVDKGFNYVDYDFSLTENGRKKLLKENTSVDINEAKNGKYYLPKGKYFIQIESDKVSFEVK